MKRTILIFFITFFSASLVFAEMPLREVRAFWLTTAWALDWPAVRVPAPVFAEDGVTITNEAARASARTQQQNQLISILDRMVEANYNTVYFQVRPMNDAFYRSSFDGEPWSQWISSERGADPGWSPLGFIIEHAHARGIEVHAWLNPFRFASSPATTGNLPTDYINTHPEWIMNYGPHPNGANHHIILNPGIPEVRTRVAAIVADILRNYPQIDGINFDDYFYKQRSATNLTQTQFDALDDAQFRAYNPLGRSRLDWRRDNINAMVREVNDSINAVAPWAAFGVSPAGVALGTGLASVAARYGVRPTPVGSDWQFNGIAAHPVAWLSENTIDFISPQIYWRIGSGNDFKRIAEWWAETSNHFGRHFFSSVVSHVPGNEGSIFTSDEMMRQIRVLRNADMNNAPGVVGFRYGNFQRPLAAFIEGPFRYQALTASFGWHYAPIQGLVENMTVSGQTLSWTYSSTDPRVNVRYVVWAIPKVHRNDANVFMNPRFLQGIAYGSGNIVNDVVSFTLADDISPTTHYLAVAVFDRFGNLFAPRVLGETETTVTEASLTFPANNHSIPTFERGTVAQNLTRIPQPTLFTWEDNEADFWIWQVATDAAFTDPIASRETSAPNFNSAMQGNLRTGQTYYWRVLSVKANAVISVSEVRVFNTNTNVVAAPMRITAPTFATETAPLTPTVTWVGIAGATYRLEISPRADFGDLAYVRENITTTSISVPSGHLEHSTNYHVRVIATVDGNTFVSQPHFFATTFVPLPPMTIPVILSPTVGETVAGNSVEVVWEEQRSRGFQVQIANRANFPPMGQRTIAVSAVNFSTTITNLAAGTWFLRMRANLEDDAVSDWTPVIEFTISGQTSLETPDALSFMQVLNIADGNIELLINQTENTAATISIFSVTGGLIYNQTHTLNGGLDRIPLDLSNQPRGVYLLQVNVGNRVETQRIVR